MFFVLLDREIFVIDLWCQVCKQNKGDGFYPYFVEIGVERF